jgi:hypothetical protein
MPGEINPYDVEIAPTSDVFERDPRFFAEITSPDNSHGGDR